MTCRHIEAMKIVPQPEKQEDRWYVAESLAPVAPLPEHPTVVCPICNWAGVLIRDDVCECCRDGCGYRWRSMLLVGMD